MPLSALARPLAAATGLLALSLASAFAAEGGHGEKTIICTNLTSGANWQIMIDYDHDTVDSHPASIRADQIKWSTTDGAHYALDRKSGNLTVTVASTTGGYFLYDHCKLDD